MIISAEPTFLTVEEVILFQHDQLRAHGGSPGIRDRGALISAVAMPRQAFGGEFLHRDLFEMAAAYVFHIAENQPFVDGNKRTALDAALTFLAVNGVDLDDPQERLYEALMALAAHQVDKGALAEVLRGLLGS